jgi:hypothetical protein
MIDSAIRHEKLVIGAGIDQAAIEKLASSKIRKNSRK